MMTNNNSNALEIKVLWINDTKEGENPIDLIDAAAEYSIDLVQHEYVESGISALKDATVSVLLASDTASTLVLTHAVVATLVELSDALGVTVLRSLKVLVPVIV